VDKAPEAFRTITEVADELDVPQHVLRFWETRFPQIKPLKRGGGRRYYRPQDVDLLRGIRHLLYGQGYTIKGVQRILRERGLRYVQTIWQEGAESAPPPRAEDADPESVVEDAPDVSPETGPSGSSSGVAAPAGSDAGPGDLRALLRELKECRRILAEAGVEPDDLERAAAKAER
jgi:DNA-binding transcriptional MerR regulator